MEILYLLFIAPLEMIMRWIMEQSYHLTHSYGGSIIILSIFVNILLLPLYHMAEKWQNSERDIQARMKEYNHFIKKSFKKQERYVMLKEMYRIFDYHPIMALRTSVGLLIQVPFFFAAYHLLSHYSDFNGKSFVFFSNLFEPDQLILLGGFHINVMPILMTVINLVSAYVYTTNLQTKDKIQLWVLAILFLGILYNSPAALVIYWTLNNIFSLCKNIVYQNISKIHWKVKIKSNIALPDNSKATIIHKLFISLCFMTLFFTIISFIGVIINSHIYAKPFRNELAIGILKPVSGLLIITIIAYYILNILEITRKQGSIWKYMKNDKIHAVVSIVSLIITLISVVNLLQTIILLHSINFFKYIIPHTDHYAIHIRNAFFMMVFVYLLNSIFIHKFLKPKFQSLFKYKYNTFFYGLLLSCAIYICCYIPISLMTNDISFFNMSPYVLLKFLLPILSLIVMGGFCLNKIIIKPIFKSSSLFLVLSLLVLLSFSFVNLNYGIMNGTTFSDPHLLYNNKLNIPFDIIFTFIIMSLFVYLISSKFYKYINKLPMVLSILMIAITTYNYYHLQKVFTVAINSPQTTAKSNSLIDKNKLQYTNNTMNFSKTHKNIVLLILDGFDGRYIQGMIDDKVPEIQQLSGFTYYANALSPASSTYPGYGAIIGGYHYTPAYIEQHHHNIMQGYQDAYQKLLQFYKSHNFETSLVHPQWMTPFLKYPDKSHCENNKLVDNCLSDFRTNANYSLLLQNTYFKNILIPTTNTTPQRTNKLLSLKLSLFKMSPLSFRQILYNNGAWLVKSPNYVVDKTKFIASMPYISTTNATTDTFKVIHSMVSHGVYNLNPKTCLFNKNNVTLNQPYPNSLPGTYKKSDYLNPKANYFDDICTIKFVVNFVKWLQDNHIYDNTKIVLASEHDFTTNPLKLKYYKYHPHTKSGYMGRPYALLMVKDFNTSTKHLTIDTHHFMVTYDTPAILCDGLINCSQSYGKNFTKENTKNRTIITSNTPWQPEENYEKHYKIFNQIAITNSIFDMNNYQQVKKYRK